LSSAADTRWPPPRWSEDSLEQFKAASLASAKDPVSAIIAEVKLLAAAGRFTEAEELLRRKHADFSLPAVHHGMFRNLLTAAILAHAHALAASWLVQRFKSLYEVIIEVVRSDLPADAVTFQVRGNTARFLLGHCLFEPAREGLLQRWADIYPMFDAFMNSSHRVDGKVTINLGDGGRQPGLVFSSNARHHFLIPDALYMDTQGYDSPRRTVQENNVPWRDRLPVALWRGSTTGLVPHSERGWRDLPRIRLCEIARDNPLIIDAGITNVVQIEDPAAADWLRSAALMRQHIPSSCFQKYRYQIDIDGNTNSWPGLFQKLLTGCPILKIASGEGFRQWYYDRLQPWINFIPVAADMSDLIEKITWLLANDEAARGIGEAGRELAESLTYEREIMNAAPVIAAAIRTAVRQPMIDLEFGFDKPNNDALRDGWLVQATDGAAATGLAAHMELPKPHGLDDYILITDVSVPGRPPRRITIIANGEIVARQSIAGTTTLYCPLRRSVAIADEKLSISLYFPDSVIAASQANPLDTRRLSATLHAVRVVAAGCYSESENPDIAAVVAELRTGLTGHDLWADEPEARSSDLRHVVHTIHGTILFADLASGRVRHGRTGAVPGNLFLVQRGGGANLVRVAAGNRLYAVRLRPEGRDAASGGRRNGAEDRFASTFETTAAAHSGSETFGLFAAGLFVSAETDGSVTLSREQMGGWERFHLQPNDTGQELHVQ
jgi:hypothetical protein